MSDVMQKCLPSEPFKNNGILVSVDKLGNKHVTERGIEQIISSGVIIGKYTDRFDEPDPTWA